MAGRTAGLVGIAEIAERLGVAPRTVSQWRYRHQRTPRPPWQPFPEPHMTVGGHPCWQWRDVEVWAKTTGRL